MWLERLPLRFTPLTDLCSFTSMAHAAPLTWFNVKLLTHIGSKCKMTGSREFPSFLYERPNLCGVFALSLRSADLRCQERGARPIQQLMKTPVDSKGFPSEPEKFIERAGTSLYSDNVALVRVFLFFSSNYFQACSIPLSVLLAFSEGQRFIRVFKLSRFLGSLNSVTCFQLPHQFSMHSKARRRPQICFLLNFYWQLQPAYTLPTLQNEPKCVD